MRESFRETREDNELIPDGIEPVRAVMESVKSVNRVRVWSVEGRGPEIELSLRSTTTTEDKDPIDEGIGPVSRFEVKYSRDNLLKDTRELGIDP